MGLRRSGKGFSNVITLPRTIWAQIFIAWILIAPRLQGESVGFEFEYASQGYSQPNAALIPDEKYRRILELVREASGDPRGVITMEPFPRKSGMRMAVYTDPKGRVWKVMPESVNTGGYDGFEFVPPPAANPQEDAFLKNVIERVEGTGQFQTGIKSSSHMTAEVSHLIETDGMCPKLYDLIVFTENHWRQTYAAINPNRYGTYVNRFAVPLALDHPELVKRIAEVPRNERTLARLKSMFESFHERELALVGNDANKAWKYRAGNYKKLLGLGGTPQAPLLEMRIGDLFHSGSLDQKLAFMRAFVSQGAVAEPDAPFRNPFEGLKRSESFADINERIFGQSGEDYHSFLRKLKLPDSSFPSFGGSKAPPTLALEREARARLEAELHTNRPVTFDGKPVTFGFEAEFRGPNAEKITANGEARTREYPFLELNASREGTGNTEVRSIPSDNLDETIRNMSRIRRDLDGDLKGFHLHFRIPKEAMEKIPKEERVPWLQRIGDAIMAWRLQHRQHFFALNVGTQARVTESLTSRGTIRVQQMMDTYDIELRGFMQSEKEIREMARTILLGVQHPELVHGYLEAQRQLTKTPNLIADMNAFALEHQGRQLTPEEKKTLVMISSHLPRSQNHLPFMGFEDASYLSPLEGRRVADSTTVFKQEILHLLKQVAEGKYADEGELMKQYRWHIQRWAERVDLESLLKNSILIPPDRADLGATTHNYNQVLALLVSDNERSKSEGRTLLAQKPLSRFLLYVNHLLVDANPVAGREAFAAIKLKPFAEVSSVYPTLFMSTDPFLRDAVNNHLSSLSDDGSRALLMERVYAEHPLATRHHAIRILAARSDSEQGIAQLSQIIAYSLASSLPEKRREGLMLLETLALGIEKAHPVHTKNLISSVINFLFDENPEIRETAALLLKRNPTSLPTEVILAQLDRPEAPKSLISRVMSTLRLTSPPEDASAHARGTLLALLRGRSGPEVGRALSTLATHESPLLRAGTAEALGGNNDPESGRLLDKLSYDSSVVVRTAVANALAERGDDATFAALERGLRDSHPEVRARSAHALGKRGLSPKVRELIPQVMGGADPEMSSSLIKALAARQDFDVGALTRSVLESGNANAKLTFIREFAPLRVTRNPEISERIAGLAEDANADVALAALQHFEAVGGERLVRALVTGSSHSDVRVRRQSALGIWKMASPANSAEEQALNQAVERLTRDPDPETRRHGLASLGLTRGAARRDLMKTLLASRDPQSWQAVVSSLASGGRFAIDSEVIAGGLSHPNANTARALAELAIPYLDRMPLEPLLKIAPGIDSARQRSILEYLGRNPTPIGNDFLLSFLNGPQTPTANLARTIVKRILTGELQAPPETRSSLFQALLKRVPQWGEREAELWTDLRENREVAPLFERFSVHRDEAVRKLGASSFGGLAPQEVLARIATTLRSDDPSIRMWGATGLGSRQWEPSHVADGEVLRLFRLSLSDERANVREAARKSLVAQGPAFLPLVEKLIEHGDEPLQRIALKAMEGRNDPGARELLEKLLTHRSIVVREGAKRVLSGLGPSVGVGCNTAIEGMGSVGVN